MKNEPDLQKKEQRKQWVDKSMKMLRDNDRAVGLNDDTSLLE